MVRSVWREIAIVLDEQPWHSGHQTGSYFVGGGSDCIGDLKGRDPVTARAANEGNRIAWFERRSFRHFDTHLIHADSAANGGPVAVWQEYAPDI